jgi:hypothetical protein
MALSLTLGRSPSWCAENTKREIAEQIRALKADGEAGEQIIVVGGEERTINIETYGNPKKGMCFDGYR